MTEDFKTYMSFIDAESSLELTELLRENGIAFQLLDTKADFDPSMAFNEANKPYLVQISPDDFEKTNKLVEEKYTTGEIAQDHFMNAFSDQELIEVLKNKEEWHPLDVVIAKKLLKKRNVSYDERDIIAYQEAKKRAEYQPEKLPKYTLLLSYLICLLGGILGVAIALFILTSKKSLPSGEKVFSYSNNARNHAMFMLILGVLFGYIFFTYLI
jgi:hypothetical protein